MRKNSFAFAKLFIIFCFLFLLVFYLFHQSKAYIARPKIFVFFPRNGASLENSFVKISGRTEHCSKLFLDGAPVLLDNFGRFQKSLLLARGYNIIELEAIDRFNRKTNVKIKVFLN